MKYHEEHFNKYTNLRDIHIISRFAYTFHQLYLYQVNHELLKPYDIFHESLYP